MVEAVHHLRIQRKATLGTMAVGGALHKYPNSAGDYLRHPLLLANWFVCHALTVLRYLRFERRVLRRDISKGNVLYVKDNDSSYARSASGGENEMIGPDYHVPSRLEV